MGSQKTTTKYVLSLSGGKDSTAAALFLREAGINFESVHMDTGWEHPSTDEYLRTTLEDLFGPIRWLRERRLFKELVLHKGMFPSRRRRYCTDWLKIRPFTRYIHELMDQGYKNIINVVGIRADESKVRAKLKETDHLREVGCDIWRPLIDWSYDDVIQMHRRHGVSPNPLYLRGAERVGCRPCIYARKAEVRLVAELTPERIDEIREMEASVTEKIRQKCEERGEEYDELMGGGAFFGRVRDGRMARIDEAVAWSKTSHGGKQLLLGMDDRSGCMRWGMCDH